MPNHPEYTKEEGDIALGLEMGLYDVKAPDKIYEATPVIVIRGQLLYGYPVQINPLNTKVKLPEAILDIIFPDETKIPYREIKLKKGERYPINSNYTLSFEGFNRSPEHPNLQPKEGDIYVGGQLKITGNDQVAYWTEPVFLIRDNQPFYLKTQIEALGFHSRFIEIDPTTETATFSIALTTPLDQIPVEVATDSLRYDYIVLEAKVFPGINLFWLGATLMMLGLLLAVWPKLKKKYALGS
jgi:cytochrome c-type biogenesis protein CcmF